MTHFTCARWRAPIEGQPLSEAPVFVFQSGHVFRDGARVGTFCKSEGHFIAGIDADTTLLVPLDQDGPNRYSAIFRIATGGEPIRRPGELVRERMVEA